MTGDDGGGEGHPAEVRIRLGLRWRDVDMLGHLNQSVYHELLEEGRWALFDQLAGMPGFEFVLARVELDYRHEVRRELGHVEVAVRVEKVGSSSVTLAHEVLLPDGTIAAEGRAVIVIWDPESRRPRKLTEQESSALGGLHSASPPE
ncbi:MAG: acyl-CoA thioesterase [Solirubrobacterales bacterium]|nr:acyl-CoA thioesterase [Solirubrobacterales bacterium]